MEQNQFTNHDIWQYSLDHTSDLEQDFQEIISLTNTSVHGAHMISEKIITKTLQFLVFSSNAKLCVDVGTYTGMSAIAMASVAPNAKVYTIDRWYQAGDKIAKQYLSKYPNIEYIHGDAGDVLPTLPNNIDIAFIDADKRNMQMYFDILIEKLSSNGIIVVDDILLRSEVLDPTNKRAKALDDFNKYILAREDIDNLILPIRHGINIIRKKI